jgi:hypothetical protein
MCFEGRGSRPNRFRYFRGAAHSQSPPAPVFEAAKLW